jgi:DNA adenine methylase
MTQKKIVNVASVPKRSPFRYPGGKTWLVPLARKWWQSLPTKPRLLVEPFAGGGIIGLTAAFEGFVEHVMLVELDPDVAAVWKCLFSDSYTSLVEQILDFDVTEHNVREVVDSDPDDFQKRAFRTIIKNRMFHGGILAPGSSMMRAGENGKGLKSRWYPKTLADRITAIGKLKDRFSILERDGLSVLEEYKSVRDAIFFIDPPYTASGKKAGSRLYRYSEIDHSDLFRKAISVEGDFLMTYDDADGVRQLANISQLDIELVAMKNTHHAKMEELLIGRDLTWTRPETNALRQSEFDFDN